MTKRKILKLVGINLITLSLFIFDRFLKKIALIGFEKDFGLVKFSLWQNPGLALNVPILNIFFCPIVLVVLFLLISQLIKSYQKEKKLKVFGLSLIIVGALSNLFDRLLYGRVIDYIAVPLTVFNLSDLMIIVGVLIVLFDYLKIKKAVK